MRGPLGRGAQNKDLPIRNSFSLLGSSWFKKNGLVIPVSAGGTGAKTAAAARENILAHNAATASFHVKNNSNQNISADSPTTLTWNTEDIDVGAYFTSNAWTPPAGIVFIGVSLNINPGGSGNNTVEGRLVQDTTTTVVKSYGKLGSPGDPINVSCIWIGHTTGTTPYKIQVYTYEQACIVNSATFMGFMIGGWL